MDKAPDFGSGDCRFESCHGRRKFLFNYYLICKINLFVMFFHFIVDIGQTVVFVVHVTLHLVGPETDLSTLVTFEIVGLRCLLFV